MRHRRRVIGAILLTGLLGSAAAYWKATSSPGPTAFELEQTKQYLRQMQTYGGNANVLASELREWLASLWHGERLAYTIAFLALLTAAGYWLLTRPPLPEEGDAPRSPGPA